jgi:hypothetical protein
VDEWGGGHESVSVCECVWEGGGGVSMHVIVGLYARVLKQKSESEMRTWKHCEMRMLTRSLKRSTSCVGSPKNITE